jgi:hypothetical protein
VDAVLVGVLPVETLLLAAAEKDWNMLWPSSI